MDDFSHSGRPYSFCIIHMFDNGDTNYDYGVKLHDIKLL